MFIYSEVGDNVPNKEGVKKRLLAAGAFGLGVVLLSGCTDPNSNEAGMQALEQKQPVKTEEGVIYPYDNYTLEQLDDSNEIDIDVNPTDATISKPESEKRFKEARKEIEKAPSMDGSESHVKIIDIDTQSDHGEIGTATAITDSRAYLK